MVGSCFERNARQPSGVVHGVGKVEALAWRSGGLIDDEYIQIARGAV
jgi:hypothetical protein